MKLTEAQRALVEENIRLASKVASKFRRNYARYNMNWEDAYSTACLGLVQAALTYDPNHGKASVYLWRGCELAILMELRTRRNAAHNACKTVSLESVLTSKQPGGEEYSYLDVLSTGERDVVDIVADKLAARRALVRLGCTLTERQKQILKMRYRGMKQKQIAQALGYHQPTVSRELKECREAVLQEFAV